MCLWGITMKKNFYKPRVRISPAAVIIWRIDLTLLMIPLGIILILIGAFVPVLAAVLGIAAAAAYFFGMFFYIPMYCKNLIYTFDDKYITIKRGIIYKRHAMIPVSSVQYCILVQGVLQKRFKRCTVVLMLAGSFMLISQIKLNEGRLLVEYLTSLQMEEEKDPNDTDENDVPDDTLNVGGGGDADGEG